jgi:hypothetical protein
LTQNYVISDLRNNPKYKGIGSYSNNLIKSNTLSAYRLLYTKDEFNNNTKIIRNNTLKKLAESNDNYFPKELQLDKSKRKTELTYEGKFNITQKNSNINFQNRRRKTKLIKM